MSPIPKINPKRDTWGLKLRRFLFSTIRLIVLFFRKYLSPRIWVIIIALLIMMFMGDLFTKYGLQILLVVLGYILLILLDKWLEKYEDN